MARFVDSNGGEWVLKLKVGHRKRLADLGVGFEAGNFGATMAAFLAACDDPDRLARVLHAIAVSPPATAEELADSFDGATFAAAGLALSDEVVDFFHYGRPATAEAARSAVSAILTKQDEATAKTLAAVLTRSDSGTSSPGSSA